MNVNIAKKIIKQVRGITNAYCTIDNKVSAHAYKTGSVITTYVDKPILINEVLTSIISMKFDNLEQVDKFYCGLKGYKPVFKSNK